MYFKFDESTWHYQFDPIHDLIWVYRLYSLLYFQFINIFFRQDTISKWKENWICNFFYLSIMLLISYMVHYFPWLRHFSTKTLGIIYITLWIISRDLTDNRIVFDFSRKCKKRLLYYSLDWHFEILPTYSLIRTSASSNSHLRKRLEGMCRVWRGNLPASFFVRGIVLGFSSFHLRNLKVTFYSALKYFGVFIAFILQLQTVVAWIAKLKVPVHFAGKYIRNETFPIKLNLKYRWLSWYFFLEIVKEI